MIAGRPRLGTFLIEHQIITEAQLETAIEAQVASGQRLGEVLIRQGFCTDADIARALADQLEIPFIDLETSPPATDCLLLLPREVAVGYGVLPLQVQEQRLLVAVLNPYDIRIDEVVRHETGMRPLLAMAPESQIHQCLQRYYSEPLLKEATPAQDSIEVVESEEQIELSIERLAAAGEQVSTILIVNTLLADAVRRGASDLHIEPEEGQIRIRCRIDGRMYPLAVLPASLLLSIVARCKILAGMDIAEARKPQDGSCTLKVDGRTVEFRVSTLRGVQGEIVVLRILCKDAHMQALDTLGFEPRMLQDFRRLLAASHGMVLSTGPTGSGKTTSLYAGLNYLNRDDINIVTIEDPVESKLAGINQIQTDDRAGRSFASSLRSVLRQDPDVIMVGEIRDLETAEIACRAALTGHLLLSTLHTQHTLGAVARLMDIGLEPWIVASCLNGVMAQRLVRRNCELCAEEYTPSLGLHHALAARYGSLEGVRFRKGQGCAACHHTGRRGRIGVYELLTFDDTIREHILHGPRFGQIKEYILQQGFCSMEDDAFRKACLGMICPEEIIHLGFAIASDVEHSDLIHARDMAPAVWAPVAEKAPLTALTLFGNAGERSEAGPPTMVGTIPLPALPEAGVAPVSSPAEEPPLLALATEAATPPATPPECRVEPESPAVTEPFPMAPTADALDLQSMIGLAVKELQAPPAEETVTEPDRSSVALEGKGLPSLPEASKEQPAGLALTAADGDASPSAPVHGSAEGDGAASRHQRVEEGWAGVSRVVEEKKLVPGTGFLWARPHWSRGLGVVTAGVWIAVIGAVSILSFMGVVREPGSIAPVQAAPAHAQGRTALPNLTEPPVGQKVRPAEAPRGENTALASGLHQKGSGPRHGPAKKAGGTLAGHAGAPLTGKQKPTAMRAPSPGKVSVTAAVAPNSQQQVWICPGGRYYHRRGCTRVQKRMAVVQRRVAAVHGRRSCSFCKP